MEPESAIIIGGVAIGADGSVTPSDTDPLDRVPDTVTFSHVAELDYVVAGADGRSVTTETDIGRLVAIRVWGAGELMAEYRHGDTVTPDDLPMIRRAADLAGVSVVPFIHGVPA